MLEGGDATVLVGVDADNLAALDDFTTAANDWRNDGVNPGAGGNRAMLIGERVPGNNVNRHPAHRVRLTRGIVVLHAKPLEELVEPAGRVRKLLAEACVL